MQNVCANAEEACFVVRGLVGVGARGVEQEELATRHLE